MSDIINEIDALIDDQLDAGEPIGGYDYGDPDYPKCPHCQGDWHGLAITEQMQRMRYRGAVDEGYRYSEDDSPVICPGSEFIGPPLGPRIHRPRIPESDYNVPLWAGHALTDGDRVACEIRGQVVTGTVSNHQTHGNTTTFDFTPDRSE